ncbi:hypothetical protein ACOME3_010162 [Neoechinorhynchus agilis]
MRMNRGSTADPRSKEVNDRVQQTDKVKKSVKTKPHTIGNKKKQINDIEDSPSSANHVVNKPVLLEQVFPIGSSTLNSVTNQIEDEVVYSPNLKRAKNKWARTDPEMAKVAKIIEKNLKFKIPKYNNIIKQQLEEITFCFDIAKLELELVYIYELPLPNYQLYTIQDFIRFARKFCEDEEYDQERELVSYACDDEQSILTFWANRLKTMIIDAKNKRRKGPDIPDRSSPYKPWRVRMKELRKKLAMEQEKKPRFRIIPKLRKMIPISKFAVITKEDNMVLVRQLVINNVLCDRLNICPYFPFCGEDYHSIKFGDSCSFVIEQEDTVVTKIQEIDEEEYDPENAILNWFPHGESDDGDNEEDEEPKETKDQDTTSIDGDSINEMDLSEEIEEEVVEKEKKDEKEVEWGEDEEEEGVDEEEVGEEEEEEEENKREKNEEKKSGEFEEKIEEYEEKIEKDNEEVQEKVKENVEEEEEEEDEVDDYDPWSPYWSEWYWSPDDPRRNRRFFSDRFSEKEQLEEEEDEEEEEEEEVDYLETFPVDDPSLTPEIYECFLYYHVFLKHVLPVNQEPHAGSMILECSTKTATDMVRDEPLSTLTRHKFKGSHSVKISGMFNNLLMFKFMVDGARFIGYELDMIEHRTPIRFGDNKRDYDIMKCLTAGKYMTLQKKLEVLRPKIKRHLLRVINDDFVIHDYPQIQMKTRSDIWKALFVYWYEMEAICVDRKHFYRPLQDQFNREDQEWMRTVIEIVSISDISRSTVALPSNDSLKTSSQGIIGLNTTSRSIVNPYVSTLNDSRTDNILEGMVEFVNEDNYDIKHEMIIDASQWRVKDFELLQVDIWEVIHSSVMLNNIVQLNRRFATKRKALKALLNQCFFKGLKPCKLKPLISPGGRKRQRVLERLLYELGIIVDARPYRTTDVLFWMRYLLDMLYHRTSSKHTPIREWEEIAISPYLLKATFSNDFRYHKLFRPMLLDERIHYSTPNVSNNLQEPIMYHEGEPYVSPNTLELREFIRATTNNSRLWKVLVGDRPTGRFKYYKKRDCKNRWKYQKFSDHQLKIIQRADADRKNEILEHPYYLKFPGLTSYLLDSISEDDLLKAVGEYDTNFVKSWYMLQRMDKLYCPIFKPKCREKAIIPSLCNEYQFDGTIYRKDDHRMQNEMRHVNPFSQLKLKPICHQAQKRIYIQRNIKTIRLRRHLFKKIRNKSKPKKRRQLKNKCKHQPISNTNSIVPVKFLKKTKYDILTFGVFELERLFIDRYWLEVEHENPKKGYLRVASRLTDLPIGSMYTDFIEFHPGFEDLLMCVGRRPTELHLLVSRLRVFNLQYGFRAIKRIFIPYKVTCARFNPRLRSIICLGCHDGRLRFYDLNYCYGLYYFVLFDVYPVVVGGSVLQVSIPIKII